MPLGGFQQSNVLTHKCIHTYTVAVSWSKKEVIKWLSIKMKGQNVHAKNESDMLR